MNPLITTPDENLRALAYGVEAFIRMRFKKQIYWRGKNTDTKTALYGACCCVWIAGFQGYPKLNPAYWWLGLR